MHEVLKDKGSLAFILKTPFESTKTYADRQRSEVSYDCMLALLFMLCCCVPAISCFSNLVFKRVE